MFQNKITSITPDCYENICNSVYTKCLNCDSLELFDYCDLLYNISSCSLVAANEERDACKRQDQALGLVETPPHSGNYRILLNTIMVRLRSP